LSRIFSCEEDEDDKNVGIRQLRDRSRAIGKISFPRRGGAKLEKKKKKKSANTISPALTLMHGYGYGMQSVGRSSGCCDQWPICTGWVCNGAIVQGKLTFTRRSGRCLSAEYSCVVVCSNSSPLNDPSSYELCTLAGFYVVPIVLPLLSSF
jgi:hypothetical protein